MKRKMKKDSAQDLQKFEGEPYLKIGNSLFGAIVNSKNLLTNEGKVFMVILFKTVGFKKEFDWLNYKQICKYCSIKQKTRISESVKNLILKGLIIRDGKHFRINQNFDNWLCLDSESKTVIRELYLNEKLQDSVTPRDDKLQDSVTGVTEKRNSKLQVSVTPSTDNTFTDKTITDNNIYSRDGPVKNLSEIEEIFNFWNSKQIIIHKSLTAKAKGTINSKLKYYTSDEITQAIENYWEILSDDKYFFTYRWTLEKFLQSGFEQFKDIGIAKNNYLKRVKNGKPKKHFENERDYTDEDREKIRKKFYRETD